MAEALKMKVDTIGGDILERYNLPDARDGLTPRQRRILWAMYKRNLSSRSDYEKTIDFCKAKAPHFCGTPLLHPYSPSNTASIKIPTIMIPMNKYCFFVNFSFKKILERINDTTHTLERIGAAIAPFPLIAYTYVS